MTFRLGESPLLPFPHLGLVFVLHKPDLVRIVIYDSLADLDGAVEVLFAVRERFVSTRVVRIEKLLLKVNQVFLARLDHLFPLAPLVLRIGFRATYPWLPVLIFDVDIVVRILVVEPGSVRWPTFLPLPLFGRGRLLGLALLLLLHLLHCHIVVVVVQILLVHVYDPEVLVRVSFVSLAGVFITSWNPVDVLALLVLVSALGPCIVK